MIIIIKTIFCCRKLHKTRKLLQNYLGFYIKNTCKVIKKMIDGVDVKDKNLH